jgi:hypothetical protein
MIAPSMTWLQGVVLGAAAAVALIAPAVSRLLYHSRPKSP